MVALRKVTPTFAGTAQQWNGDDINNLVDIIQGNSSDKIASGGLASVLTGKTMDYNANTFLNFPSAVITASSPTVFTNKTMDYNSNTFLNLPSALVTPTSITAFTNKTLTDASNAFRKWVDADMATSAAVAWSKISKAGSVIADIANVVLSSPSAGQVLQYNGANWVNAAASAASSAQQFGSYTIYIETNGAIKARNNITGSVDFTTASAPATSAQTQALFQSVADAIKPTGGMIFIKRGLYLLSVDSWIVGDSVTYPNTSIFIKGEGFGATTVRAADATGYGNGIIRWQCDGGVEDINFDGNYMASSLGQIVFYMSWATGHLWVNRCKFQKATDILFRVSNASGLIVTNCWFAETTQGDQLSQGARDYAIIAHNFFDKRTATGLGVTTGSNSTNGASTRNIMITDNVFLRNIPEGGSGGENAISIEAFSSSHFHYLVSNNICSGGRIALFGLSTALVSNVKIINNLLHEGGAIQVDASGDASWPHNDIVHVDVSGNTIYHSNWGGIMIFSVGGPITIHNNQIIEWNYSDAASTSRSGIYIDKATDLEISGNQITQTDATGTEISKNAFHIRGGVTNLRFFDNKIKNTNGRTIFLIETADGANSNVQVWDNEGYATNKKGVASSSGNGSITDFVVTHGLAVTPTIPIFSTNQNIHAYVSAISSTTFTVKFVTAPPSGTVSIYWDASKTVLA